MIDLGVRQATRRLIEQHEARPQHQAAGDLEKALLGMLQQIGAARQGMAEPDAEQELARPVAQRALLGARPRQRQRGAEKARDDVAPAAQHGVVEHRQGTEQTRLLEGPGDAVTRARLHAGMGQPRVVETDLAAVDQVVARHHVEQGRLAAAVGADQPVDLARLHVERHLVERDQAAEAFRDLGGAQRRHRAPRSRRPWRIAPASRSGSGATTWLSGRAGRKRASSSSTNRPKPSGVSSTTIRSSSP